VHATTSESLSDRQVATVCDYIEARVGEPLRVAELAAEIAVSPTQLTRLFRTHTGDSPYQYLRRRRVEFAERLITGTDRAISEIAVMAGFSDQSHLTRVLRAERGISPGELRRARR
jgi:AraC family transcriptional regulator